MAIEVDEFGMGDLELFLDLLQLIADFVEILVVAQAVVVLLDPLNKRGMEMYVVHFSIRFLKQKGLAAQSL